MLFEVAHDIYEVTNMNQLEYEEEDGMSALQAAKPGVLLRFLPEKC